MAVDKGCASKIAALPQGRFCGLRRETTFSSLRARWMPKTVVQCKFMSSRQQPPRNFVLVVFPNCGEMKVLELAEATVSSLRARRASKTVVKCKFSRLPTQPSRHFVLVGRSKRTVLQCKLSLSSRNPFVVLCSSNVQNCDEI